MIGSHIYAWRACQVDHTVLGHGAKVLYESYSKLNEEMSVLLLDGGQSAILRERGRNGSIVRAWLGATGAWSSWDIGVQRSSVAF